MNLKNEIDPELLQQLSVLKNMPVRDPGKTDQGLTAFLDQARITSQAVTLNAKQRHNGWMQAIQSKFMNYRKEHSPMFSTISTILLIVSLALGGGGVTVAAAQSSQPDQPLYALKLISEDIRLGLSSQAQSDLELALQFTDRRSAEIIAMAQKGGVPGDEVLERYQNQVEQALHYALNLPDDQVVLALAQVKNRLQTQEETMLQIQATGKLPAEALLLQVQQMLQQRLRLVEGGLTDPSFLRDQLRERDQLQQSEPIQQRDQTGQASPTNSNQPTQQPAAPGGGNPWVEGTPTPGSGYGPGQGAGDCETCTPAQSGQDGNPWVVGTPTPGSSYGPGAGTCTPVLYKYDYGTGPHNGQPENNGKK